MKRLTSYKSFFTYLSFSLATSALGFTASLVLIRLIPPSELGRIALFTSIQFLVAPLISFAADNLIAVNRSKLDLESYLYFRRSYATMCYLTFIFIQICFLAVFAVDLNNEIMFLLIPIGSLLKYLINLASIEYVMENKSIQYGLVQFSTTGLSLLLTVLFVSSNAATADWRIIALLIADLVFLLVRYNGRMHLLLGLVFDWKQYKEVIRFGFPLLLAIGPAWILNEADKLIVAKYADLASVGIYMAACSIGGFMVTFNASLLNATIPKLYAALAAQPRSILVVTKRYLWRYVLISIIFAVSFSMFYGMLSEVILPAKYAAARQIVYWVIFFSLTRSFYSILGAVTDYLCLSLQKLKSILIGAVFSLIGMFVGVSQFGIAGVAIGAGLGYTALSISLWFFLTERSRTGVYFPGE